MSKISFTPEIYHRPNAEGKYAIMIRVTQNRKSKRITLNIAIELKYWNKEKKEIRKNCPEANIFNALITKTIADASLSAVKDEVNLSSSYKSK
jgi:Arm DNA-binding domain